MRPSSSGPGREPDRYKIGVAHAQVGYSCGHGRLIGCQGNPPFASWPTQMNGRENAVFWPLSQSQCSKVASCFYSCLRVARNVGAAEDVNINVTEPIVTLPNCLTYRQVPGVGIGASSAPARRVPVLFSTNRGLYLRVAQPQTMIQPTEGADHHYDISFCDLERWSTNRANVVSLEDTFSIMHPQPQLQSSQQQRVWNNFGYYNLQR